MTEVPSISVKARDMYDGYELVFEGVTIRVYRDRIGGMHNDETPIVRVLVLGTHQYETYEFAKHGKSICAIVEL